MPVTTSKITYTENEQDAAVIEGLKRPVGMADIKWRQASAETSAKVKMLGYIDARYVMDRLDECAGATNWSNEYMEIKDRIFCRITINFPSGKTISKMDCGAETRFEQEKGVVSDALKRTAVLFGIGRDLYSLPDYWAETNAIGKTSYGWQPPNSLPQPKKSQTEPGDGVTISAQPPVPEPPPIAYESPPTPPAPPPAPVEDKWQGNTVDCQYGCGAKLMFDKSRTSDRGKMIPIDMATDEPHSCPSPLNPFNKPYTER